MRDNTTIMRDIQRVIREQLNDRGISLKVVAAKSGLSYSTLCSYFPGNERGAVERIPAEIPGGAMRALCGALPDDLLNLMAPDGYAIVRVPDGVNHDVIAEAMHDFLRAKEKAHHPDSEEGREIGPNESNILCGKFAVVQAKAA